MECFNRHNLSIYRSPNHTGTIIGLLLVVLLIVQPCSQFSQQLEAQGPDLALKGVLDQLESSLQGVLNTAQADGTSLVLTLGAQLQAQIDLIRVEFANELDQQRIKWSDTLASMIDNIRQSIADLVNKTLSQAQDLINQVQLIAISLPFAHRVPEVRSVQPYVTPPPPAGVDDLVLNVAGIFPDADRKGYLPFLTIGSKPYVPLRATAAQAEFHLPKSDLTFPGGEAIRNVPFKLSIPYRGRCFWIFPCKKIAILPESVGLLPSSPGNLHISYTFSTQVTSTKASTSYPLHLDASSGDRNNQPMTFPVDPGGWEIVPGSVQVRVLSQSGDAHVDPVNGNCSTQIMACWQVSVIQHHCVAFICLGDAGKGDGNVNISLTFEETMTVSQAGSTARDIAIGWGQTALETMPTADAVQWTATYTDFNNVPHPFGSSNSAVNSDYLKESTITSNTLAFSVYPFGVDAGADLTTLTQTAEHATSVANLQKLGLLNSKSLNPQTQSGFHNLKMQMLYAVGNTIPNQHAVPQGPGGPLANVLNGALSEAGDIILMPGNSPGAAKATAPVPVSAQEKAFRDLQHSIATSSDHM